jgi:hypothetical protein
MMRTMVAELALQGVRQKVSGMRRMLTRIQEKE